MSDLNLSLQQFIDVSNGSKNAGQVDVVRDGRNGYKLTKVNHHVHFTGLNNTKISPDNVVRIKESFIKALENANYNQDVINEIKKELGLTEDVHSTMQQKKDMYNRRFTPLTRQQIKDYISLASGQNPDDNPNLKVQQNVLKGLPKDHNRTASKVFKIVSYLSGVKITDMPELNEEGLRFFKKQPKILGEFYKKVNELIRMQAENPGAQEHQLSVNLFTTNNHDHLTLKITRNENNISILSGSINIDGYEIPLNYNVSPQEYLNTIDRNLVEFMDVMPDARDENNISIGRNYLLKNLADLKKDLLSQDELNGTQPNHLRSLALEILKKDNENLPENIERLSTEVIVNLATIRLRANDLSIAELNSLVGRAVDTMQEMANFLVPGHVQHEEPQQVNNNVIVDNNPQPQQENYNVIVENNLQQPQQGNNNVNVNNNPQPQQNVNNNAKVEYEVEDPNAEVEEEYELPEFNDNKTLTSFANKLFDLGNADNFDFAAFKTLLLENFDVFVSFGVEYIQLGDYEEVQGDKTVTIKPKFTPDQLLSIFDKLAAEAKTITGTEMDGGHAARVPTANLKKFLQLESNPENLKGTIKRIKDYVTTQLVRAQQPPVQNPVPPVQNEVQNPEPPVQNEVPNPVQNQAVNVNNVQNEPEQNNVNVEVNNVNVDAQDKVDEVNINEINEINEEEIKKDPHLAEAIKVEDSAIRDMLNVIMEVPGTGSKAYQILRLYESMYNGKTFKALVYAVEDKEALKKALSPKLQPLVDDIHAMLKEILKGLHNIWQENDSYNKKININNLSVDDFETLNFYFSNQSKVLDRDKEIYAKIIDTFAKATANSSLVEKAAQNFQSFINEIFKLEGELKIESSYDKMSVEEIKNSLANKNLDQILEDAKTGKGQPGKTAFNLLVLKNYFIMLPKEDIIKIMGEAFMSEPSDPDKNELAIAPNKRLFSSILKGCGPLMQKMLQGMSKDLADKSYGDVFDELKSNLKHIDDQYVSQTVESYISQNRNKHVYVTVKESLGSASVAETFKCKVKTKTRLPESGWYERTRDCVVKVKRPGVQQRAENEAKIFNEIAKQVPGMSESWNNQLQSIMREFDFENEAKNIDECYDVFEVQHNKESKDKDIAPHVSSLSRDNLIPVTNEIIVTQVINGDTVDKVYTDLENDINNEFKNIFKINSETGTWEVDKNGNPVIREDVHIRDIILARRNLPTYIQQIFDLNSLVKEATGKWLKEVIFNTGVIHNDIHGGNLMITHDGADDTITFIDFGNVIKISKESQAQFKDLLSYTMQRDSQKFTDTMLLMIPNKPNAEQKAKMTAIVESIMQKGHSTDDAGYRLSAIIVELRKLGITFSSELEGIANGLNRMQAFAENTNRLLKETKKLYELTIGKEQLSPYKNTQSEIEDGYEGELFDGLIDYCFDKNADYDECVDKIDTLRETLKDPNSEVRVKLPFKILKDAFDGNFSYTEKFVENYINKNYVNELELDQHNYVENITKLKNRVKEAKEVGISLQQIQSIMEKKTIPEELKPHEQLINQLISQLSDFTGNVVYLLDRRAYTAKFNTNELPRIKNVEPTVDKNGKVLSDPFETNSLSVEGVLGNMITKVNNFTMTQVNPPVAGEIANQNNQKPLVEVSNNPLGHERTEGKIAS